MWLVRKGRSLVNFHPAQSLYQAWKRLVYCASVTFVSSRERERDRERETHGTSIDITLKLQVIMHMITSTARTPYAPTRSEPVECSSA